MESPRCFLKRIILISVQGLIPGMLLILIQANAEILAGYVLANLIKEGTPFIYGGGVMAMDMSTSVACYASASSNSVSVNSPCGSRNFPVGPMLPATYFPSGLTSLAILAACRLSS